MFVTLTVLTFARKKLNIEIREGISGFSGHGEKFRSRYTCIINRTWTNGSISSMSALLYNLQSVFTTHFECDDFFPVTRIVKCRTLSCELDFIHTTLSKSLGLVRFFVLLFKISLLWRHLFGQKCIHIVKYYYSFLFVYILKCNLLIYEFSASRCHMILQKSLQICSFAAQEMFIIKC